ncbi:fasciclin-like arabinogalactan protein 6 [Curcuma longa]|uniref:fasciclin-like arabinogalactan protein 6 n=1 Tax=Curcuma longa TaxID=136217 RepID=UPI003D9EAB75
MALRSASSFVLAVLIAAAAAASTAEAQQPTAAPSPSSSGPINITDILVKGGQYSSFIHLLHATRVDEQIDAQLNTSFTGMTVFAPTDNAFRSASSLNGLTQQQQIELALYHVVPQFFTLAGFQTASNPILTDASGVTGQWTVNVTAVANSQQVNISTGVVETQVGNALRDEPPLVVYSLDKVLLPYELFPSKSSPAPPPSSSESGSGDSANSSSPAASAPTPPHGGGSSLKGRSSLIAGVGIWAAVAAANWL